MICKNCQHDNPEPNRFCGMCGQPLFRPQSNARSTTNTAAPAVNNARQTSYLSSRDTTPVNTLPPLAKPQSAAPSNGDKKVQFPPIAAPPETLRATTPATATPTEPQAPGTPGQVHGTPGQAATAGNGTSATTERRAPTQPTSTSSPITAPQPSSPQSPAGVVEKRGPFPRTPLGPQPAASTSLGAEKPSVENKIQTPGGATTPQSATPPLAERRAQNQPYSQLSDMRPWTSQAVEKPAAPEKPVVSETTAASERRTQPLSSSQRPTEAVVLPAKRAQTSAPVRVSGPSFLGLSDDAPEEATKDKEYDDLYKTHWGGRIAIVVVILGIAGGLVYLQWRSGHPSQAAARQTVAPKPPTAARVDNTTNNASVQPSAPGANNSTNPPATAPVQSGDHAAANNQSVASNATGSAQLPNGSNPTRNDVSAPASSAAKSAAPEASNTKAVSETASIREGHEVAGKSQEDLEEPVRLAENYIQGRGVAQNCSAALGILRNASDRGNPRAEIKLGALYATGNCVAPDRVAAYRHFSRAIAAQPNNVWLEQSRSRLWSDMSADERKQAMEVEK